MNDVPGCRVRGRPGVGLLAPVLLGLAVAVANVAGTAWACVPQPLITLRPQSSGPPGTKVTVEAIAVNGAAELRWNGPEGPRLATGSGPGFSAPVMIPDAPPGLYALVLVERRVDGSLGSTASVAFQVLGPGTRAGAADDRETPTTLAASSKKSSPGAGIPVVFAGGLALGGLGGVSLARRRQARPGKGEGSANGEGA